MFRHSLSLSLQSYNLYVSQILSSTVFWFMQDYLSVFTKLDTGRTYVICCFVLMSWLYFYVLVTCRRLTWPTTGCVKMQNMKMQDICNTTQHNTQAVHAEI